MDEGDGVLPDRTIKVLYISSATHMGGAENSLLYMVEKLDKKRVQPVVACPQDGDFIRALKEIGIQSVVYGIKPFLPVSRKIGKVKILDPLAISIDTVRFCIGVLKLVRLIREARIDIVHANDLLADIYGGIAAKASGVPIVWHLRDMISRGIRRGFFNFLAHIIPDKIIAVSKSTRESLDVSEEKVSVIYNGVDLKKFGSHIDGSRIKRELNPDAGTRIVGMVGRLSRAKGFETFLMAAKAISERIRNTSFMIVGGPKDKIQQGYYKELKVLSNELGLGESVSFVGERKDMPEVYSSMDVLLLPSLREAFPRSILEAQACGIPAVATNVGGVGEILEDGINGFMVNDWKDYGTFAAKTVLILENQKLRHDMGNNGAKKVRESFDINRIVAVFENIYKEILPAYSNIL